MQYPGNPAIGQQFTDTRTGEIYTYSGINWHRTAFLPSVIPRDDELKKYPSLKNAWEEYLMVRKLLGLPTK